MSLPTVWLCGAQPARRERVRRAPGCALPHRHLDNLKGTRVVARVAVGGPCWIKTTFPAEGLELKLQGKKKGEVCFYSIMFVSTVSCSVWACNDVFALFIYVLAELNLHCCMQVCLQLWRVSATLWFGVRALEQRLTSCGTQGSLLRGLWDLPGLGIEPMSPALAGRFSTTGPPGKSLFL